MLYPPRHICERLFEKNPQLRLAWWGEYLYGIASDETLSWGAFAVVRLYPRRLCGPFENPRVFQPFWDADILEDEWGLPYCVRADRGMIFNRRGESTPDWDLQARYAVIEQVMAPTAPLPLSHYDVYSGKFLKTFDILPNREARRQDAQRLLREGKELESRLEDNLGAVGEQMAYHFKNDVDLPVGVSPEDKDIDRAEAYESGRMDMSKMFLEKAGLESDL